MNEMFMKEAMKAARKGIAGGQAPFGACIVRSGKIIAGTHNRVWDTTDPTAHAEVQAIREACRTLKTIDLQGCEIYSTCEPCPMCFSAIHWARIEKIVYGATITDARRTGFNELQISNRSLKKLGKTQVCIQGPFLRDENIRIFEHFLKRKDRRLY